MGYVACVTPATNDGGFDIKLVSESSVALVECKCYNQTNKIGRPSLQKLVGANSIEHADKLIFITTSSFTPSALEYAIIPNIETINGLQLITYLQKYLSFLPSDHSISISDSYLNIKSTYSNMYHTISSKIYYR